MNAPPAPRSEFLGKNVEVVNCEKKSSGPVGGQLSKVSANLPVRAAPARRHGGTQLMSRTNYEAVSDYVGHWAGLAFERFFRSNQVSNQVSHIVAALLPKIPCAGLARAWCGPPE